jgi:hypothetical protein
MLSGWYQAWLSEELQGGSVESAPDSKLLQTQRKILRPYRFFAVGLDAKQKDFFETLFINRQKMFTAQHWENGMFPVLMATTDMRLDILVKRFPSPLFVFLDFEDRARDCIELGQGDTRGLLSSHDVQILYVKLQVLDPSYYCYQNPLPAKVHVLSCPLLLGGSRFHITNQVDDTGDCLFRRVYTRNSLPEYEFDWSWVGAPTSRDRRSILSRIHLFDRERAFVQISKKGHQDAAQATVPYEKYIEISRRSRVCLSLNGFGPWCLKDGEMLANNCFILRQDHSALHLNPLSPQNNKHWVTFCGVDDCIAQLKNWVNAESEREKIRQAGFDLMGKILFENYFANHYAAAFETFVQSQSKDAWGSLAIG